MLVPRRKRVYWLPRIAAIELLILAREANAQVVNVSQGFKRTKAPGWSFLGNGANTPAITNILSGLCCYDQRWASFDKIPLSHPAAPIRDRFCNSYSQNK